MTIADSFTTTGGYGSQLVLGQGPIPCSHMIVGEAPGAEEERLGVPFVGASGQLLNEALEDVGRDRKDFYVTNAYKSRPPGNRNPTTEELKAHSLYLRSEFSEVAPSVVLILGRVARDTILPDFSGYSMAESRETWFTWDGSDLPKFLVTYHPSFVLRGGVSKDLWIDDIRVFAYET